LAWLCAVDKWQASATSYGDGDHYRWHCDHNIEKWSRPLSFIIYLNDQGFTGGETNFSMTCNDYPADDEVPLKSITPKTKRMIMFASYIYHSVNPVNMITKVSPFEERRLVINGHLRFNVD